jgi:glycosyltransferase involved in cell wall biosynthesis
MESLASLYSTMTIAKDSPKVSVVMITMNEEKAVAKVIRDIKKYVPEAEILLVDSSKDKTAEIAQAEGAKVIKQFPPKGYGPAMDLALKSGQGDVVVTLDCDDSYPAEMIPILANYILKDGFDLVDGSRLKAKPNAMPLINFLANWGFALIASILFMKYVSDLHSGMRAYRKTLIHDLKYQPKGAALPVELLLRPIKEGKKVKIININYNERIGVSTMNPLDSAWWTIKRIMAVRFS